MSRPNWDPGRPARGFRLRGFHPLWPGLPAGSPILSSAMARSRNPGKQASRFGLLRFRSPLLAQSLLISSPPGTEMFHFPGCRSCRTIEFIRRHRPIEDGGFPHSEIHGSKPVDGSPWLIAVCRVLHRLMMPRHPSCARIRLARNFSLLVTLQFSWFPNFRFSKIDFDGADVVGLTRVELVTSSLSGTRSNQLSYKPMWVWWRQPDSNRRPAACKAATLPAELCPRQGAPPSASEGRRNTRSTWKLAWVSTSPPEWLLLRKEVIQPLVPQRLPCYDFIPITTHTLDGQTPGFGCRRLS